MSRYILTSSGNPVLAPSLREWAEWYESAERTVKRETVGPSEVSTVFLGFDHSFGKGPPVLWETMVFGGPLAEEQDRCAGNREQAEAMHEKMIERVKGTA